MGQILTNRGQITMIFILGAIIGGCIGFVMAAIMSNAHDLDEQERRKGE